MKIKVSEIQDALKFLRSALEDIEAERNLYKDALRDILKDGILLAKLLRSGLVIEGDSERINNIIEKAKISIERKK